MRYYVCTLPDDTYSIVDTLTARQVQWTANKRVAERLCAALNAALRVAS